MGLNKIGLRSDFQHYWEGKYVLFTIYLVLAVEIPLWWFQVCLSYLIVSLTYLIVSHVSPGHFMKWRKLTSARVVQSVFPYASNPCHFILKHSQLYNANTFKEFHCKKVSVYMVYFRIGQKWSNSWNPFTPSTWHRRSGVMRRNTVILSRTFSLTEPSKTKTYRKTPCSYWAFCLLH